MNDWSAYARKQMQTDWEGWSRDLIRSRNEAEVRAEERAMQEDALADALEQERQEDYERQMYEASKEQREAERRA